MIATTTKRILVSGSAGQLGGDVVGALRRRYDYVVASDVKRNDGLQLDVRSRGALERTMDDHGIDCIVHLASCAPTCPHDTLALTRTIEGVENVLDVARRRGAAVVLASSFAAYGSLTSVGDDSPLHPETADAVAHVYAETLGLKYRDDDDGFDFRALRIPAVVAPGGVSLGAHSWALRCSPETAHLVCVAPATRSMPMIYVDDVARGFADFVAADENKLRRRVYNLVGFHASPADLGFAVDREFPVSFDVAPPDDRLRVAWPAHVAAASAVADWGWRPRFNVDDAARAMFAAFPRVDLAVAQRTAAAAASR